MTAFEPGDQVRARLWPELGHGTVLSVTAASLNNNCRCARVQWTGQTSTHAFAALALVVAAAEEPVLRDADNPVPEHDRHCSKRRRHEAHAFHENFWFGCPGTPDVRDTATVAEDARKALDRQEAVRRMELLTYDCGQEKTPHHDPHTRADGQHCPGVQDRYCGLPEPHRHHRWWVIPEAFYWCDGLTFIASCPVQNMVADL